MNKRGFVIFMNTLCQGAVSSRYYENEKPAVFKTELEAQREIVDLAMTKLQHFMDGELDFDDATTVEEYVLEVDIQPDGSIVVPDEITGSVIMGIWLGPRTGKSSRK